MAGQATIDDRLVSNDDRHLTVIARLSPVDSSALAGKGRAASIQTLKDHAARTQTSLEAATQRFDGVSVRNQFWLVNAVSLDVDTDRVSLAELADVRGVERLHANIEFEAHGDSDDRRAREDDDVGATEYTYGLEMIHAPETWSTHGTQGDGVSVAVLDTGVDGDHPDHEVAEWAHFDGSGDPVDSDPNDGNGHGTHVAGTAVGTDDPDGDVPAYGVAPEADLWGVKVLDDGGGGTFEQIIAGMEWTAEEGADVANMSLGTTGPAPEMIEPTENLVAAGTLLVSSIGNGGEGTSGSPGNVYPTFASGAVDENEDVADFSGGEVIDTESAWGGDAPEDWPDEYVVPDAAAPGVDVLSSVPGGGYDDTYSGTSMSSPHKAGAVALMLSAAGGGLDIDTVTGALEETAWKPDDWDEPDDEPDIRYGYGIIDAEEATSLVALDTGVEGTVEMEGEPVEGAVVEIEGATVETDEEGAFSRPLEPGEYEANISGFGIQDTSVAFTVEDGDEFTDIGVVEVDPAVDLLVSTDQQEAIEAGDPVSTTLTGANVDSLTVDATGDYDEAYMDLFVAGEQAEFGDPVDLGGHDGDISVTVETTPDTAGELGLDHTASGPGDDAMASSGPTGIFEELTVVGVIDAAGNYGSDIVDTLDEELADEYYVLATTTASVVETPGDYDVAVAQLLADGDVGDFVDTIETSDTGAVYLDQWGSDSDAIPQYAGVSDEVTSTGEGFSDGEAQYGVSQTHPIFQGFDEGEEVLLHTGGFDDYSYFETVDDGQFEVIGDQLAGSAEQGDGVAVDDATGSVLATSLGRQTFAEPEDFTADANQILAQAVSYAAVGGLDTGVEGVVESDGVPVEDATVELGDVSATTDEDGAFTIFAEPGEYDLSVSAFGFADETQSVEVEDGEELTNVGTIELDPAVDIELVSDQPDAILAGSPIEVTAEVANVDELTIDATGDYDPDNADLFVAGDGAEFGDPIAFDGYTGELDVTVETTEDTDGEFGMEHSLAGPGDDITVETGPTLVSADIPGDLTYGLEMINAPQAWSVHNTQGAGVSVAIIDSGVDGDHPDHDVVKWAHFDENGDPVDSDPNDGSGHGTHVAGTATGPAFPEGDVPGYGVAPDAELWGVKVLDDGGGGTFEQVVAGMEWTAEEEADVANMSLGADGYAPDMVEPSENLREVGTFLVSSIGNGGAGTSGSPGNVYPNFASGAVDEDENVASFSGGEVIDTESAWGSDAPEYWPDEYVVPDAAAPGVDVLSSVPGGGYDDTYSGTSMSSPHKAGAAAIMLSAAGSLDLDTIADAFEETAWKPDDWDEPDDEPDTRYGFGIIDVEEATSLVALETGVEGIVESDGEPVEGAQVEIDGQDVETDEGGAFALPLEPGEYDATISGFGLQSTTVEFTVEDGDEFTDIGVIEVAPAVELAVGVDQQPGIEAGDDVTATLEAANVDSLTVEATGDYDPDNADLFVAGDGAEFGDPVDLGGHTGDISVTVETTPDTAGELGLDHTASGPGDDITLSTGPTDIVEELVIAGIVDPAGNYGEDIAETLAANLGGAYEFEQTTAESVIDTPGNYDVVVVQRIDDDAVDVADFVETTETTPLGAVYLDQWGSTNADSIPQYEEVSEDITETGQGIGDTPQYEVLQGHPILQGFEEDEVVTLLDGSGDFSYFETTDDRFEVLADSLDAGATAGQGLAVDEPSRTVLAGSLGRQGFAEPEDFTAEANQILAQAVNWAAEQIEDAELELIDISIEEEAEKTKLLSVTAQGATEVTIDGCWADWEIDVADASGADTEDRADTEGDFLFEWDTAPLFQTPAIMAMLPDTHVGGEYLIVVTATDGEETVEGSASYEL